MEMNYQVLIEDLFKSKEDFLRSFSGVSLLLYGKKIEDTDDIEKYLILGQMLKTYMLNIWRENKDEIKEKEERQVYYFSMEFLLGRMLKNNLMALGTYDLVKDALASINVDLIDLEELEADAGLGNGGLGRLAACFLDSLSSLKYPGNGNTIRYKNGLFKQLIEDNKQVEVPDQWLRIDYPWEIRKPDKTVDVRFYGEVDISRDEQGNLVFHRKDTEHVLAVPYDLPIVGADGKCVSTIRMWSAEPSDDLPKGRDYRQYLSDVDDICLNLYPDDSTEYGKMLRIKQEYFFVAAGLASIIKDHLYHYDNLDNFAEKVVIQLNDTHPALAIPELMRLLIDDYAYKWEDAFAIVKKTFAYTNHTTLPEALEKWPVNYIKQLLPRIYMIIVEMDRQFKEELNTKGYDSNFINSVSIISEGNVRMANLSIYGSFSVNGVAKIHSDIIKHNTFKNFYELYPDMFNNKTNGVTPRRWLLYANPELSDVIEKYIGPEFRHDFSKISDLLNHLDNEQLLEDFLDVKQKKKDDLAHYLYKYCDGIVLDPNSIFDTQIKRLHAYKRQLLNVMHIIYLYYRIKDDKEFTMPKTTFLFGAKAASSYTFAKKVIELINSVAEVINEDPEVNKYINVVFVPNYRVTLAEKLIPASDISEQISTAGKEASGTSNMKFMMNGAFTLGTLDGANVEIKDLVGEDNCVIFGLTEEEVKDRKNNGYSSYEYYQNNGTIMRIINSFITGPWAKYTDQFKILQDEFLLNNDEYMLLADFESYVKAHEKINELYADKKNWARMCLYNIAKSAFFSSDRTIEEYATEIWKLNKLS